MLVAPQECCSYCTSSDDPDPTKIIHCWIHLVIVVLSGFELHNRTRLDVPLIFRVLLLTLLFLLLLLRPMLQPQNNICGARPRAHACFQSGPFSSHRH